MAAVDERQNILQLPVQQKIVVVALKHVFDKIKNIQEQELKELAEVSKKYRPQCQEVEERASAIIKGTVLNAEDLINSDKYFTSTQKEDVQKLRKQAKGIDAYWHTVLINFYGEDLTAQDKQLSIALQSITANTTQDFLEITFEFSQNAIIKAGKITRRFVMLEEIPVRTEGDKAEWLKAESNDEGLFRQLMSDSQNLQQVTVLFTRAAAFVNEIVPYSLQFFLGVNEDDEEEEEGEGAQEEDDDDDQEEPVKKVKQ